MYPRLTQTPTIHTMKLLAALISISLLQAIYAAFAINILVPDQWKDSARATGKKESNGTSIEMYRAKNDPNSSSICPIPTEAQTATGTGCDMTLYFGVTSLHFSEPTTDPRPVNISMGEDVQTDIKVSSKCKGSRRICLLVCVLGPGLCPTMEGGQIRDPL